MENYILTFNTILFCCLVVSFLIYKKAYIKGKLTCNNFILNSYLYILLSLLLICNTVILADKTKMNLFRKFLLKEKIYYPSNGIIFFSQVTTLKNIEYIIKKMKIGTIDYFKK